MGSANAAIYGYIGPLSIDKATIGRAKSAIFGGELNMQIYLSFVYSLSTEPA